MVQADKNDENEKMSPKENAELDQADELRKLFLEVENSEVQEEKDERELVLREIDILQLPPRKEVHEPNKRVKLKFSRPLFRFILFIVIIIAVIIGALTLLDWEWYLF